MANDKKAQIIKASWVSIIGNGILSALKISIGLIAGSLAVVGDGIDSFMDIVTSIITLITARIISRPPNAKYPYGYEKADTIASKALSFVIFFAGAQLAVSTIRKFMHAQEAALPDKMAIVITIVSIFGKLALSYYQFRVGKKNNSVMLISNAKNMQNDVLISLSVLTGLIFTFILKLPIIDSIAALAVSLWIMKVAFDIFMDTNTELMDGVKDPSVYDKIFEAVDAVEGASNPHRVRSREIANMHMIVIDIETDGNIPLSEAHEIAHQVEEQIRRRVENVYDIVVHVEPAGNDHEAERFGISRDNVNENGKGSKQSARKHP